MNGQLDTLARVIASFHEMTIEAESRREQSGVRAALTQAHDGGAEM